MHHSTFYNNKRQSMDSKYQVFSFCCVLISMLLLVTAHPKAIIFDVKNFGAVSDGKTDNTKAFLTAWGEACKWEGEAAVFVPEGTYMLGPVKFSGPCKGPKAFLLKGVLKAPSDLSSFSNVSVWIQFCYLAEMSISGGGTLDGQGQQAWARRKKCKLNCLTQLPGNIGLDFVKRGRIQDIMSIDSKSTHVTLFACENMNISNVRIVAPGDSPNTDGIKVANSHRISVSDTDIRTGDDCIAILSTTSNINISNVFCGPGHGISIGSLGKYKQEKDVRDISVMHCTFNGSSNGVRIKTWAADDSNLQVSSVLYKNLTMLDVKNPVIIDQHYCPYPPCDEHGPSRVKIRDVTYSNVRGSSQTNVAITFNCSRSEPCTNIRMEDIDLWHQGKKGDVTSICSNAIVVYRGEQNPKACSG